MGAASAHSGTPLLFWFGLTTFLSFTLFLFLELYTILRQGHGIFASIRNRDPTPTLSSGVKINFDNTEQDSLTKQEPLAEQEPLTHYRLIDDYTKWHRKNRHSGKKLVWRCPQRFCGGLGDRIRSLVLTYFVAVVNERVFLIDWNDPVPLSDLLVPNLIDWRFDPQKDSPPWDSPPNPVKPLVPRAINYANPDLILSLPNHTLIVAERVAANFPRVLNASNSRFYNLLKESRIPLHTFDINRAVLRALFKPSSALSKRKNNLRSALRIQRPYLAIHARVGVGVGEMKKYAGRFSQFANNLDIVAYRLVKVVVDRKKLENITGSCSVFLATDTPALRPLFEKEIRRQDKSLKLIGGNWVPHHYIESNRVGRSEINAHHKAFWDMVLDLTMLGEAQSFVHLRSGFSDAALWLGNAKSSVLVKWGLRPHDMYRVEVREVARSEDKKIQTLGWKALETERPY
eukprot:Plantae.Rhodophyta-Hildenbrandia_rubra.ctg14.p1 GENE.Plantae.Rhodophyta-Hildenbrandia_rubra.ctg14~~Plantae.Rhodophyta-Hildenbrandia_rubra.ctg14.p1  ORF type:complete len:458 (-),score=48.16 Plantae.Rhodophyta-Hildenbrandia_rubra.ctg14:1283-2656(-)